MNKGDNSSNQSQNKDDDDVAWEKEKKEFWEEPTAFTPESRKQVIIKKHKC